MFKKIFAAVALLAAGLAMNASAATVSANFQVKLTVLKACSVVAGAVSDIDLGSQLSTATNLAGTSNIAVTCSKSTPYFIGLAPSNSSTTGAGVLSSTTVLPVETVAYQLRSAPGTAGAIWGNTATATAVGNGVARTGTGAVQSIPVYATVPTLNVSPDAYLDTVTVTVNY